ncbi:MAG: peptidoglycan DD-metalloendopeptidase family protein, partial [Myxococcales bacterium]|nr:peptidoglycan DD-metalloendopeptidase family protein [Myxococcales bacterium]
PSLERVLAPATPTDAPVAADPSRPRSEPLSCGLSNPMPGGFMAGYRADTGLDIAGMGLPVFAIASGTVEYAEAGHTLWTGPGDTDRAIRIRLDEPIAYGDRKITHVWYAHMNELAFEQAQTSREKRRVAAGEYLGTNGKANGMWHLHLGLLLDGDTSQGWGTFLLEDEVRAVLCGMRAKQRLPVAKAAPRT